jgi:hypothetical protein
MSERPNERIDRRTAERDWPDYVVLALGVIYLAVGALGFTVTGNVEFADNEGDELFAVFRVNPLHNIVHLAIGIALVGAFIAGRRAVIAMAWIIGATYLIVGVVGPFLSGESNILALNNPDHVLHLGTALVLLLTAFAAGRGTARTRTRT